MLCRAFEVEDLYINKGNTSIYKEKYDRLPCTVKAFTKLCLLPMVDVQESMTFSGKNIIHKK